MNSTAEIIKKHFAAYPKMQLQDAVKLIYQNEFGCGHMISDASASLEFLGKEWNLVDIDQSSDLVEDIGNGFVRVNLSVAKRENMTLKIINDIFVKSANMKTGSSENFRDKLDVLQELCEKGELHFEASALDAMRRAFHENDYQPIHHSKQYRELYKPAYRVVCEELLGLLV